MLGSDRLGKLGLTREGCMRRNRLVYKFMREYLQEESKLVITMGGGYPKDRAKVGINTTTAMHSEAFHEIVSAESEINVIAIV